MINRKNSYIKIFNENFKSNVSVNIKFEEKN